MPLDLPYLLVRLGTPFDPASRFYWPFVAGVFAAIVANVVWYYWRGSEQASPAEVGLRAWAFWVNVIFLIWALVLLMAKVPFWWFIGSFAANGAALVYIYAYWLPPRDAAWERELRRLKYIPKPERRKRRRR